MRNFSFEEYRHIINWVKDNYDIIDYNDVKDNTKSYAIIRHDVEFSPIRSLQIAKIDNELGIKSSYFFQLRNNCYNSLSGENIDIIKEISDLGHYIGSHINTSEFNSAESLESFVVKDIETLKNYTDIKIDRFSFHRPKPYQLREYMKIQGYVNAYDDKYFHYFEGDKPEKLRVRYIADSSHLWKYGYPTDEYHEKLHLVLHPYSWTEKGFDNYENFKSVIEEKNEELVKSYNSETKNFPMELL